MVKWMNGKALMGNKSIIEMHRSPSRYHKYMPNPMAVTGVGNVVSNSHAAPRRPNTI